LCSQCLRRKPCYLPGSGHFLTTSTSSLLHKRSRNPQTRTRHIRNVQHGHRRGGSAACSRACHAARTAAKAHHFCIENKHPCTSQQRAAEQRLKFGICCCASGKLLSHSESWHDFLCCMFDTVQFQKMRLVMQYGPWVVLFCCALLWSQGSVTGYGAIQALNCPRSYACHGQCASFEGCFGLVIQTYGVLRGPAQRQHACLSQV
jgi:hypothetical protein